MHSMRLRRLIRRSLVYYWRTNLAVVGGTAIAVAVLSGALLVGQSVRDSLRSLVYERLGACEYLITADRFFREDLAKAFIEPGSAAPAPIVYLQGVVIDEANGRRAYDVSVYGVDDRFWELQRVTDIERPHDRTALVGTALAEKLQVRAGDGLLLRIETQQGVPKESLYGRRENVGRTIRLTCGQILQPQKLGDFALRPTQGEVFSLFVPLTRLQKDLAQASRANAIILGVRTGGIEQIRKSLKQEFTLDDLGIRVKQLPALNGISVESGRIILDRMSAQAALDTAADIGARASAVLTYLANSIRAGGREVPYSVITAADLNRGAMSTVHTVKPAQRESATANDEKAIWLNEWAARDLGVSPGDSIEVDYYIWLEEGRLATQTARFRLAGIVPIGGDVDRSLAPDFPGVTDARSLSSWDPPFPLDLRRIRPQDEEYWNRFKATPKAFVRLATGQQLWQTRFGNVSAVRVALPSEADAESTQERFAHSLRNRLNPEQIGFAVTAVKEQGVNASQGSTDLGEYFVYFSFFLIAAAILLSAMFFRLGIEQRAREIGLLQAVGFSRKVVSRVFLIEGTMLSILGSLLGLAGSMAYGWLMVLGLRTWWSGAVGTHRLSLHVSWIDLITGAVLGILSCLGTAGWTLRMMRGNSPRALLTGVLESASLRSRRGRRLAIVSAAAFTAALLLLAASAFGKLSQVDGFFGAGLLLLVSVLSLTALYLRQPHPTPISGHGYKAILRFGIRNAMHRPGRTLLCIALIGSATFIIVAVEAFRQDPLSVSMAPQSGTGGYPLMAHAALPIVYDPNTDAGRDAMGISGSDFSDLRDVSFVPFRERPGDDASCLNLYAPREPRILGASDSFVKAARFSFQQASFGKEQQNPWLLLQSETKNGSIPAIADANTIEYTLHLALGREITVRGRDGTPVRLRLVAALRDSILQGEILISEANFLRVFPEQEGYRFFLLDAPAGKASSLIQQLEANLGDWGLKVESTRERLIAYHRVENTYISTFQSLGALGLILGTAGLATVLLRNVLERRGELALLRAVGYRKHVLSGIVVAENVFLLILGLASGTLCALLSIAPVLHTRGPSFSVATVGIILLAILFAGLSASFFAVVSAFRSPLLEALRSE